MKPSTLFQLVAFFVLYDVALAAPRASSAENAGSTPVSGATGEETSGGLSADSNPPRTSGAGHTPTTGGAVPVNTNLSDSDQLGGSDLEDLDMNQRLSANGPIGGGPSSGKKADCPDGRLFNIEQACVDHCAGGTCYSNMFTPPIGYTAHEYAFHKDANAPPATGPGGDDEPDQPGNSKRATHPGGHPPSHNGLLGAMGSITGYSMKVESGKAMQIWVCGSCPSDAGHGILESLASSPTPVTPITASAKTSTPGRTPTAHSAAGSRQTPDTAQQTPDTAQQTPDTAQQTPEPSSK
ncbi:MAG: hypothetical protein Q9160_004445 [Pyrenula sp. 1 TL-2023]